MKKLPTSTQMTMILVSMLKELEYLFCSNCVLKRFTNEEGKTVTIILENSDDEKVSWDVYIDDAQVIVAFSDKDKFVSDCMYMLTYYNVYDFNTI